MPSLLTPASWEDEKYRALQGTYPVISLSFANVKEINYQTTSYRIRQLLMKQYEKHAFLRESEYLSDAEKDYFDRMRSEMSEEDAPLAIYQLSDFLCRYYGKKVIILLDEYDTPMQEAYVDGISRAGNEPSDCLQADISRYSAMDLRLKGKRC